MLKSGCPLSFETGGTIAVFFLNFVPLHIESPYNFGGTGPILGVNGHAESFQKPTQGQLFHSSFHYTCPVYHPNKFRSGSHDMHVDEKLLNATN